MNPLILLIIWITLLWTISNFLTAFWDWHVPNCAQLFWCSLNSAVEKEIVAATCQRDSWENQMPLASSLVSIRKHNDLTSSEWSIFIFTFEITSHFAFRIIFFVIWTHSASWLECSSHWSEQLYWVLLFYFDSSIYTGCHLQDLSLLYYLLLSLIIFALVYTM